MQFAIFALSEETRERSPQQTFNDVIEQSVVAEELGFAAVWLAEHHFTDYGIVPSLAVLGAAIAQRTTTLRIGTGIAVLPFHDPRRLAEDFAVLDVLSNGRLDVGVGRGYQPAEFEAFDIDMDDARERFEEALEIMTGLWTTDGYTFEGKHHRVRDLTLYPKPLQQPHPPVWMAAVSPESFELAARAGRQILTAPQITPLGKIKEGYDRYRSVYHEHHGVTDLTLPMQRMVYVGSEGYAAYVEPQDHVMWYQTRNAARMSGGAAPKAGYKFYSQASANLSKVSYDDLYSRGALLFGDAETVIQRIETLRDEVELNYLICWMNFGGMSQDLVLKSMERFASDVMPAFAD